MPIWYMFEKHSRRQRMQQGVNGEPMLEVELELELELLEEVLEARDWRGSATGR